MGPQKHEEGEEGRIRSRIKINAVYTAQMFHAKDEYPEGYYKDENGVAEINIHIEEKKAREEGIRLWILDCIVYIESHFGIPTRHYCPIMSDIL